MSTIIRWNPFREIAAMQSMMDRFFDDAWRNFGASAGVNMLALDVSETDEAYYIHASVPGLKPEQININLQDGILTINAELPQPETTDGTRWVMQERVYGKFSRSLTLPQAVDSEKVEAAYDNGVLTLTLPKLPSAQPRQIPIKTANLLKSTN